MKGILTIAGIFFFATLPAQHHYTIDISHTIKEQPVAISGLGGTGKTGDSITANSLFISQNGKPFFPVMGEIHFSRYPAAYWEESILKMKAGGINVIATYVFWNLHEPKEGIFDWAGDRDLRRFAGLCTKHGIYLLVRIGPYGHGEIRNGAIPEWLYGRAVDIRTDDAAYLLYVKRLYGQIAAQLKGNLYKEGAAVIGIQLENEYQHAGSAWTLHYPGAPADYSFPASQKSLTRANTWNTRYKEIYKPSGDLHMANLKKIALEAGLDVPLFTATGWGYAAIVEDGSLPVSAAYAYPSWGELEPSPFYLFKDLRTDPDYGPVRYNPKHYPGISAEMGSGIMITYDKRPRVPLNSFSPMMVRAIGSGSNGIGYYMYHGGSTPVQNGLFMSEEPSGLPKISYDFQAPIGEFGQIRDSYHDLLPLHLFLRQYGSILAPMAVSLPSTNTVMPGNTDTLRYVVRSDGKSGFVFIHNYQDHVPVHSITDASITLRTTAGIVRFPASGTFTIAQDESVILPFNLELSPGLSVISATVQPLTTFVSRGKKHHVFMSINGLHPELNLLSGTKKVKLSGNNHLLITKTVGKEVIVIVPKEMTKRITVLDDRLLFSTAPLIGDKADSLQIISTHVTDTIWSYPAAAQPYVIHHDPVKPGIVIERPDSMHIVVRMETPDVISALNDIFLRIHYTGDFGQAFLDGQLVADQFYYGDTWDIGLKRFARIMEQQPMYLFFHAMKKEAPYLKYLDRVPSFDKNGSFLRIDTIEIIPEFKTFIQLK